MPYYRAVIVRLRTLIGQERFSLFADNGHVQSLRIIVELWVVAHAASSDDAGLAHQQVTLGQRGVESHGVVLSLLEVCCI